MKPLDNISVGFDSLDKNMTIGDLIKMEEEIIGEGGNEEQ